jgi:hypothetical protein
MSILGIFILSCMTNAIFWYMAAIDLWYLTLLLALLSLTKHDYDTYMNTVEIQQGLKEMRQTKCCNTTYLQNPKSIKTISRYMRGLTGILACIALISTFFSKDDITNNIGFVSICWMVVSLFWLLSIIPPFVSLLQCAASKTTPAIIKYRTIMSVNILHDGFLGVFWFYLSSILYDLFDDADDTEWRTIFLSMLWWHLLILCILAIHRLPKKKMKSCCSVDTISCWQQFVSLLAIFCIYIVIISRMRIGQLIDMKMSLFSLFVFEISFIVLYFCRPSKKDQRLSTKDIGKRAEFLQTWPNQGKNISVLSF